MLIKNLIEQGQRQPSYWTSLFAPSWMMTPYMWVSPRHHMQGGLKHGEGYCEISDTNLLSDVHTTSDTSVHSSVAFLLFFLVLKEFGTPLLVAVERERTQAGVFVVPWPGHARVAVMTTPEGVDTATKSFGKFSKFRSAEVPDEPRVK